MHLFTVARPPRRFPCSLVPVVVALAAATTGLGFQTASAQTLDCGRLQQQIAQLGQGGGNRYAAAARKQASELARTQAYAHQLACDSFTSFFGGNPQCGGLNQRIQQMQANLGQLQAAGGSGQRGDLVARFNAYCRGGQPPRQRGFFESIFGGGADEPRQAPLPDLTPDRERDQDDDVQAHGGGQAVCVRTCDGGFFPLGISARHSANDLNQMCQALCPGTDTAVYTRNPDSDIKTAVGLDGQPYVDMPNAMKFEKTFVPQCSCRPAGKSWAEALANAEEVLGNAHRGDIMVTPEKSDELSRPKLDPKTRSSLLRAPTAMVAPAEASRLAADAASGQEAPTDGSAGVKRPVRQVGPQP